MTSGLHAGRALLIAACLAWCTGCQQFVDHMWDDDGEGLPSADDDVADDDVADDDTGDDDTAAPPVAVCAADPPVVSPLSETTHFLGHSSYDPGGHAIVSYDWVLETIPDGSSAFLNCADEPDCGPFVTDIAGSYTMHLTVHSKTGLSGECSVDVQAVPEKELWIELYWVHPQDDMDLHLLAPGGTPWTDSDCYAFSCMYPWGGLDWGVPGDTHDDPYVRVEDEVGTGPEIILINAPAAGVYTVWVYDNYGTTHKEYKGLNLTEVRVYTYGVLAGTVTNGIVGEEVGVDFCHIDWPAGTVTPL